MVLRRVFWPWGVLGLSVMGFIGCFGSRLGRLGCFDFFRGKVLEVFINEVFMYYISPLNSSRYLQTDYHLDVCYAFYTFENSASSGSDTICDTRSTNSQTTDSDSTRQPSLTRKLYNHITW